MSISPNKTYREKGLKINEAYIARPLGRPMDKVKGVCLYLLPTIPLKSIQTQAESYISHIKYYDKTFVPHWIVDNFACWNIVSNSIQSNHSLKSEENKYYIGVALCGHNKQSLLKGIILICILLKKFNLGLNQIRFKGSFSDEFKNELEEKVKSNQIPLYKEIPIEVKEEKVVVAAPRVPELKYDVYFSGQWQAPQKGSPIQQVRLTTTMGDLKYRTHLLNGGWTEWVSNGQSSGRAGQYIDGFQFEFELKGYQFYYSFSNLNSQPISLRTKNFLVPTGKKIDQFTFKILKEGL